MEYIIVATRDSVCMGDDCMAPNRCDIPYHKEDKLSDLMSYVYQYVPTMKNTIWVVRNKQQVIGYLMIDEEGNYSYELEMKNKSIYSLGNNSIHCSYFYKGRCRDCDQSLSFLDQVKSMLSK